MRVLYFAQAADAAGCRLEEWNVGFPLTLDAFWEEAIHRHPDLSALRPQCRVASGMCYLMIGDKINPADETAVIPPVSGG
ncbi:MAG: MoaD/ThiS family protein [Verrucomicrobiota bacterium]